MARTAGNRDVNRDDNRGEREKGKLSEEFLEASAPELENCWGICSPNRSAGVYGRKIAKNWPYTPTVFTTDPDTPPQFSGTWTRTPEHHREAELKPLRHHKRRAYHAGKHAVCLTMKEN